MIINWQAQKSKMLNPITNEFITSRPALVDSEKTVTVDIADKRMKPIWCVAKLVDLSLYNLISCLLY